MTLTRAMKGLALCVAVLMGGAAMAQWNLNWYADPDVGAANTIVDGSVVAIPEGNPIYLLWAGADGTVDGLDLAGFVQGDDRVVVYEATGNAVRATVGDVDWVFPPNDQPAGEFNETANGIETLLESGETLYAVAFDFNVGYNPGAGANGRFVGTGFFGISPTNYSTTGLVNQSWDTTTAGNWVVNDPIVPEPTTVALMLGGLAGVMVYRRRRQSA